MAAKRLRALPTPDRPRVARRVAAGHHPGSAALALRLEYTALALNPRMNLFGAVSGWDLAARHGLTAALSEADLQLDVVLWALYDVRRTYTRSRQRNASCLARGGPAAGNYLRMAGPSHAVHRQTSLAYPTIEVSPAEVDVIDLSQLIRDLREELEQAVADAPPGGLRFKLGPIELEVNLIVEQSASGGAKVRFWVLDLSADASIDRSVAQKIKLTLRPHIGESDDEPDVSDQPDSDEI